MALNLGRLVGSVSVGKRLSLIHLVQEDRPSIETYWKSLHR